MKTLRIALLCLIAGSGLIADQDCHNTPYPIYAYVWESTYIGLGVWIPVLWYEQVDTYYADTCGLYAH
jgi:hypothetical protein